jgi:membrane protein DedA with SNARE-associated domain
MTFFASIFHLLGLLAPALWLAVLLWLGLMLRRRQRKSTSQPARQLGWLLLVGVVVVVVGLAFFGRDAKMATYAALVLVQGTLAWRFRGG